MPVKWDEFVRDLDLIIEEGAQRTDDRLASRISSITRMTDEEVKELFPVPADAKKLAKLLNVVNAAEERNTKINNIIANTEEFAGVILTLLKKFT